MHGDKTVQSTVEVQVDTPVVFYQTKETSLHVSCCGSMHGKHAIVQQQVHILTSQLYACMSQTCQPYCLQCLEMAKLKAE